MTRAIENCRSHSSRHTPCAVRLKRGFTLVEVLVVISIIGLLIGLLLPAINAAKKKARMTTIKSEMSQFALALEDFRTKVGGGQYPPDGSNYADWQRFFKAAFPRVNWGTNNGQIPFPNCVSAPNGKPTDVGPDTALCFWLGGAQDSSGAFIGFSANPANPFDASASRVPISYEFDKTSNVARFLKVGTVTGITNPGGNTNWILWQFYPVNGKDVASNVPYLYFKAVAGQYGTVSNNNIAYAYWTQPVDNNKITAFKDSKSFGPCPYSSGSSVYAWMNPKTYQILCPGLDGRYGTGNGTAGALGANPADSNGLYAPLYSDGPNYNGPPTVPVSYIADDMTNFTQGPTVSDDQ